MMNLLILQEYLKKNDIESILVPINDEFFCERIPEYNQRLSWLTNFSGSYAIALVMHESCYFFTDARYIIQSNSELNTLHYKIFDVAKTKPWEITDLPSYIFYDIRLFTNNFLKNFKCDLVQLKENPIDILWKDRPKPKSCKIYNHLETYSGESSIRKCTRLALKVPFFITDPDSVSWIANIRSNEVLFTPSVSARAILHSDGKLDLFMQEHHVLGGDFVKDEHVNIFPIYDLEKEIAKNNTILFNDATTSKYYSDIIEEKYKSKEKIVSPDIPKNQTNFTYTKDPIILQKACKNNIEIQGAESAHINDAISHIEFFYWLIHAPNVTELSASAKILELRSKHDLFVENSFETISAFGKNGAIIHYHPTDKSNTEIMEDGIYLIDSGGQYLNGTTDITRTVSIGNPTLQQKFYYTMVLKGLISLTNVVFPKKTTGLQLDCLARTHLWKSFYNFPHGTGHGVGSFLSVHEGPHGFSTDVEFLPGMIVSNEPGFYLENQYGIRLENLMYVYDLGNEFLSFKTLTLVPFDLNLINFSILSIEESMWVKKYHNDIISAIKPHISDKLRRFYMKNFYFD